MERRQRVEVDYLPHNPAEEKYLKLFVPHECPSGKPGEKYWYRLYSPKTIEPGRLYPLVITMHGGNNRGKCNEAQLTSYCVSVWADLNETGAVEPCFVLAPQQSDDYGHFFENDIIETVMADAIAHCPIDQDRVYLTGSSMGGMGAWGVAARHPELFAAILTSAGIFPHQTMVFHPNKTVTCTDVLPEEYEPAMQAYAASLRDMPIRQYYSECDIVAPVYFGHLMEQYMAEAGATNYEAIYFPAEENVPHSETYQRLSKTAEPFTWLLSQRRRGGK